MASRIPRAKPFQVQFTEDRLCNKLVIIKTIYQLQKMCAIDSFTRGSIRHFKRKGSKRVIETEKEVEKDDLEKEKAFAESS